MIQYRPLTVGGGGGGGGDAFTIFQTDLGTYPVASGSSDTISFTSASMDIEGDSDTDTISFELKESTSIDQLAVRNVEIGEDSVEGSTKIEIQALNNTEKFLEAFAANESTAFVMQMTINGPRFGINTAPNAPLHVNSGATNTGIRLQSTSPDAVFACQDSAANSGAPPYFGGRGNNHIIGRSTNVRLFIQDSTGNVGIGTESPGARLHAIGSAILGCPDSALADASLGNGQVHFWVDEVASELKFKVKLSGGTVKTGSIPIT